MTAGPRDAWFELPATEALAPEQLRAALARPADRAAALLHLQARLAGATDPHERLALVALLPTAIADLTPELQLRVAAMYKSLGTWHPGHVLPDWRGAGPAPPVAQAWLRLELAAAPARLRERPADDHDVAALRGLAGADLPAPAELLRVACDHPRVEVQREGLRLLGECLHAGLVAPALAAELLVGLLASEQAAIRRDALARLAEPWAHALPCPRASLLPLLASDDVELARAAVRVAGQRELVADLRALAEDPDADPRVRADALAQAMARCERDVLAGWLALVLTDVALFGAPGLQALRALHRRAIFVGDEALPAVLALACGDPTLDPGELAALCFTARKPLLRRLAAVPADDPRWPRLLPLLCALDSDEAPALLLALLAATTSPPLRRQLLRAIGEHGVPGERVRVIRDDAAQRGGDEVRGPLGDATREALAQLEREPGSLTVLRHIGDTTREALAQLEREPVADLAALRRIGDATGEALVLAQLEREPTASLVALRRIGGAATVAALTTGLGLDDEAGVRPHLCADAADAAALLWHLVAAGSPVRARLLARLAELPPAIRRDLEHARAAGELERLLAAAGEPASVRALELLGRVGDGDDLVLARDLLRRVVSEVVAGVLIERDRAAVRVEAGPVRPPEAERQIPQTALQAVRSLGERLHARGAVRPACLIGARDDADAGARVLAELLLDLLAEPLDPDARAIVLHALTPLPDRRIRRHVHRLLRDPDARVRAAAVACLARHGPEDLCASLVKLADAGADLSTARQALLALGEACATTAAATIAAWLDHPNMNLKKAAAEALRCAGAPEVVPALVRWLGAHDNPGLRAALSAALVGQLGDAVTPTLLAAIDAVPAADPHAVARWRNWLLALDGRLDAPAVLHAARRAAPWLQALLGLLVEGAVKLRRGGLAELAALLRAHGLPHQELVTPSQSLRAGVRALHERGLHDDIAADLLRDSAGLTARELAVVRPYLREWLLALSGPHGAGALGIVLRLADAGLDEREREHIAAAIDRLSAWLDDGPREPLLALIDVVLPRLPVLAAWRLAERLRTSAPRPNMSQRSWLQRLRRCGVVLVPGDVERALHDLAGAPRPDASVPAVLHDAFAVAPLDDQLRLRRDALAERLRDDPDPAHLRAPDVEPNLLAGLYLAVSEPLRAAVLDRLLELRPLGVDHFSPAPPESPLHQPPPPSAATLQRLLARLARPEPHEREHAADALLWWPDPAAQRAVLTACLEGHVRIGPRRAHALAPALAADPAPWIAAGERDLDVRARVVTVCGSLDSASLLDLAPTLIRWWTEGPEALQRELAATVRTVPAARLLPHLEARLVAGEWHYLELLAPPATLPRAWQELLARAPTSFADRLRRSARVGTLEFRDRPPSHLLADLRAPVPAPAHEAAARSPAELREQLRGADPEEIRQALKDMSGQTGDEWLDLLVELVGHASPRVRLQAHRLLRTADRGRYLDATLGLLDDPDPNIQRAAIRAVSHAGHAPAVAPLITRLARDRDPLHREVVAALRRLGPLAREALLRARGDARPDRRARIDDLLAAIAADRAASEMSEET